MTNSVSRFKSKPVVIEAIQWNGFNRQEIYDFTNGKFVVLTYEDRINSGDPDATASIFDDIHSTWVLVLDGNWIIKGTKGKFYPCDAEVFAQKYEAVE